MSLGRPQIFTAVTVPAGGWAFDSDVSVAAQYDTACDVTVPAGTYFVRGDNQSDDLLRALQLAIQTRLTAIGANRYTCVWIDPDTHKVAIAFVGAAFIKGAAHVDDVRINWPSCAQGLYEALGFDGATADAKTTEDEPIFSADWQHAWGWYSDEDGQLAEMPIEDANSIEALQSTSLSGRTKSQILGDRYTSWLRLAFLERNINGRTKVFSRGVAYGAASVYPYERNQPLECWWMEARKGTRFRVYPNSHVSQSLAVARESALIGAGSPTKSWNDIVLDTDPQQFKGGLVYVWDVMAGFSARMECKQGFHVASNAAATVTFSNDLPAVVWNNTQDGYYFDHRYQTYVLDLDEMSRFAPMEIPALDRFNISIPLKRYVA